MIEGVSRRAFTTGSSSGTYNVHALELAALREQRHNGNTAKGGGLAGFISLTVRFLDDTHHVFHVKKRAKGGCLLEQVYQHLELVEKDYFGVQFSCDKSTDNMRWLDPSKQIKKQLNNTNCQLYFRVKFYVSDPSKLQEEYTRYQFCLQIRRDILERRLILAPSTAILLASYTVQAELGDYHPDEHGPNYLSDLQLIPDQNEDMERKIAELHKLHKNQLPAEAEFNFLDHAKKIDMYGVELHRARDSAGKEIRLGVTHIGLVVFHNDIKINTFSWSKIMKISFKRKQFFIQLRRELSETYDTLLGFNMETYRSCKNLWKSCVEHHTFFRLHSPKVKRRIFTLGSKFTYSGRTEFQTVSEVKQQRGKIEKKFVRSPSKQLIRQTVPISEDKTKSVILTTAPGRPPRPYDNKVTSLGTKEPRRAWTDDGQLSDDDGGFLERTLEGPFSPGIAGRVLSYADEEPSSPMSNNGGPYDTPPYSASPSHSPTSQITDADAAIIAAATAGACLVTVTILPDDDRRYGFNVKGGEGAPISVSRVAPNTPAARCVPRLSEGDQVVQINGVDVSHGPYEEAVELIQKARKANDGQLVLVVRPNVLYSGVGDFEEPPFHYVPVNGERLPSPSNVLGQSMLLLADGLASGALIVQYETLYRKHPDLTCDAACEARNVNKNRYRDISPYDSTRVVLQNAESGDYINANFVNMSINGTDTTNKYIATQGPLSSTTDDFWQMIVEQDCRVVVMLTTLVERGRAKCHKYWPPLDECLTIRNTTIRCTAEVTDPSNSYIFRDLTVVSGDDKHLQVTHMQYVAWPDHGVPDSPAMFLEFTDKVREFRIRSGMGGPVVVHCSAGIGRTGVLVLMETALCLIEKREPVYPLEIVRTMREQRAMMIQNASQYRFVCESVHAAYLQMLEDDDIEDDDK